MGFFKKLLAKFFKRFRKEKVKIGIFGPPNSGKTTLANRILNDLGLEDLGEASPIPHETREVQSREDLTLKLGRRTIDFDIIDTPGLTEKVEPKSFTEHGVEEKESKKRTVEAIHGVVESIRVIDKVDAALVLLDAQEQEVSDLTRMLVTNLEYEGKRVLIVVNKIDLNSDVTFAQEAFPDYNLVLISAKTSRNLEELYDQMIKNF